MHIKQKAKRIDIILNMKLQVLSVVLVLAILLVCAEAGPTRSRRQDIDSASVEGQDATDDSTQDAVIGEDDQADEDCPEQGDMRRKKRCGHGGGK